MTIWEPDLDALWQDLDETYEEEEDWFELNIKDKEILKMVDFPQKVNLRVDSVNDTHVHTTLFMNGAMCGSLVFCIGEYQIFAAALGIGAEHTQGHLVDNSDSRPFEVWAKRSKKS